MSGSITEQQIAELVRPSLTVAYYMSDSGTARASYGHDGQRPVIEDVETLCESKPSGKLIQVDSIDAETDSTMDTFIVPSHLICGQD